MEKIINKNVIINNYIIRSLNHEMYLQLIQKTLLSLFDDKRCYINNIKSKAWNKY